MNLHNQSQKISRIINKKAHFAILLLNNHYNQSIVENTMYFWNKLHKKSRNFAVFMQNNLKFMQSIVKYIGHFGTSWEKNKNFAIFLQNNCEFMQSVVENITHFRKKCKFCLEISMSLWNQSGKSITFWKWVFQPVFAVSWEKKKTSTIQNHICWKSWKKFSFGG